MKLGINQRFLLHRARVQGFVTLFDFIKIFNLERPRADRHHVAEAAHRRASLIAEKFVFMGLLKKEKDKEGRLIYKITGKGIIELTKR